MSIFVIFYLLVSSFLVPSLNIDCFYLDKMEQMQGNPVSIISYKKLIY